MSKLQEIRDALVEISAGTVDLSYKEDGGMENVYLHAFMDQTEIAYQLLSTLDALMETHVLVPTMVILDYEARLDMIGYLLPLAKGYVHMNSGIRSNETIIEDAEAMIAAAQEKK